MILGVKPAAAQEKKPASAAILTDKALRQAAPFDAAVRPAVEAFHAEAAKQERGLAEASGARPRTRNKA